MFDIFGPRFFPAMRAVVDAHLAAGNERLAPLIEALDRQEPDRVIAVQEALAAIEPKQREAILAETHRRLALDGAAILDAWKPSKGAGH